MSLYHTDKHYTLYHGDCLQVLRTLPDDSVDAVVTDPPYGLSFMGKRWDYDVPSVEIWQQVLRVLKPGGHLLAFAGTRTQHRMAYVYGVSVRSMFARVNGYRRAHGPIAVSVEQFLMAMGYQMERVL